MILCCYLFAKNCVCEMSYKSTDGLINKCEDPKH